MTFIKNQYLTKTKTCKIKSLGIDRVYCLSVNDAFVMNAWAKSQNLKNVDVIPDGSAEFTRKWAC